MIWLRWCGCDPRFDLGDLCLRQLKRRSGKFWRFLSKPDYRLFHTFYFCLYWAFMVWFSCLWCKAYASPAAWELEVSLKEQAIFTQSPSQLTDPPISWSSTGLTNLVAVDLFRLFIANSLGIYPLSGDMRSHHPFARRLPLYEWEYQKKRIRFIIMAPTGRMICPLMCWYQT